VPCGPSAPGDANEEAVADTTGHSPDVLELPARAIKATRQGSDCGSWGIALWREARVPGPPAACVCWNGGYSAPNSPLCTIGEKKASLGGIRDEPCQP
jgi:hypothetical protein